MILSITGTRRGMSRLQRKVLPTCLATYPEMAIHGGAEGVDEQVHDWLCASFRFPIQIYPVGDARWRYWHGRGYEGGRIMISDPVTDPLIRNLWDLYR